MEKYLQQLIEEIRTKTILALQSEEEDDGDDSESFEDYIASVEEYLHGDMRPLSRNVGVEKYQLPPVEKLSDKQVSQLFEELERLLNAKHYFLDFPKGVPTRLKYELIHERWDSEQVMLNFGEVHMEFCDYDPASCRFPEKFCQCKDLETEVDEGEMNLSNEDEEDIPF